MTAGSRKVIFDTNVWISFLIGKRLSFINRFIADGEITIVVTEQLLKEIKEVTGRNRLKKYFPPDNVAELIELLLIIAERVEIRPAHFTRRDPKDNFLLDVADFSKATYLVTGDRDLSVLNSFKSAMIVTPADFEKALSEG